MVKHFITSTACVSEELKHQYLSQKEAKNRYLQQALKSLACL